jgi:hypothetical protein
MQTKFKIVETEEYYLAVSDEEIKENNYFHLDMSNTSHPDEIHKMGNDKWSITGGINFSQPSSWTALCKKIVAHLPKNNVPELDLPLLPEIIIEPRGFDEFQYTEQDMINLARNISYEWYSEKLTGILDSAKWTDNYLQSLKQSKTPTHFEADVEYIHDDTVPYPKTKGTKLKTELINGKETLVGNYLFE